MKSNLLKRVGRVVAAVVVFSLTSGCGGGSGGSQTTTPPATAASLNIVSGNNQSFTVGKAVPMPLVVRVGDQTGRALAGAIVTWTVTSGGGTIDHASTSSGSDGTASVRWKLGTQAGPNGLIAATGILAPVSFNATGNAGPPANITVARPGASMQTGDVIPLGATASDAYGNDVPLPTLTWTSSDAGIARVTADGFVIALGPGDVSIAARSANVVGSMPLTINAGITISLGPEETVFSWASDRCQETDVPDVPAHAVRLADGSLLLVTGHESGNYVMAGADFSTLYRNCSPTLTSHNNPYPESYDNYEWIHSVYREGSVTHALIHNEYHDPISAECASSELPCWYNSLTYASSTDDGHTFTHLTPPAHVVAPPWQRWDPTGPPPPYGYFNPSNIVQAQDGYYYAIIVALDRDGEAGGCVMRTQTLGDPTSWRGWDGKGFNLLFSSPYTGPEPGRCMTVIGVFGQPTLTYNTYLQKYMMFGEAAVGGPTEIVGGIFYMLSSDLINWTPARFVRAAYIPWCCFDWSRSGAIAAVYPSVIDHADDTPNFERPGQNPYLYYTRPNGYFWDRDLVRVPMTITAH